MEQDELVANIRMEFERIAEEAITNTLEGLRAVYEEEQNPMHVVDTINDLLALHAKGQPTLEHFTNRAQRRRMKLNPVEGEVSDEQDKNILL